MQEKIITAIKKLSLAVDQQNAVPCSYLKISPSRRALPCKWKPTDISKIASDIAIKAKTQQLSSECVEQIIRSFSDLFNQKCGNPGKGMYSGVYKAFRMELTRRGIIKVSEKTTKPSIKPTYVKPGLLIPDRPNIERTVWSPNLDPFR